VGYRLGYLDHDKQSDDNDCCDERIDRSAANVIKLFGFVIYHLA